MEFKYLHVAIMAQLQKVAGPDGDMVYSDWDEADTEAVMVGYYDELAQAHPPAVSYSTLKEEKRRE